MLTVLTHTPAPRIRLGQDAVLDLSFAYAPPTPEPAASLAPGPPPFGLEWRRQHLGKGHLLLAATPGLHGQVPAAQEGAVAFATWDDEPWGPWTGNGTFWLPAVRPFQEGTYLATVHLPYLQGQVALQLTVHSEWGLESWGYGRNCWRGWGGGRVPETQTLPWGFLGSTSEWGDRPLVLGMPED